MAVHSASAPASKRKGNWVRTERGEQDVCTHYLASCSCSRSVEINSCSKDIAAFGKARLLTQVPPLDTDTLEATFSMGLCREPYIVKP